MNILIIDDDVHACEILEAYLHEAGYDDIMVKTDPHEAYAALTQGGTPFDCILLDIVMPKIDGIELCRDIRRIASYKNTPIIMITGMKDRKFIDASFRAGASDYITKPFDFVEVNSRIHIAKRMISERKAAIDSYLALRLENEKSNNIAGFPIATIDNSIDVMSMNVEGQNMVSLQAFENYLDKLACSEENNVKIAQVQIGNIDAIYSNTTSEEFLSILTSFTEVLKSVFDAQKMFISHIGMGTFIFAMVNTGTPNLGLIKSRITTMLAEKNGGTYLEIVIGDPIQLYVGSAPNFDRLIKVAKARIRAKRGDLGLLAMAS